MFHFVVWGFGFVPNDTSYLPMLHELLIFGYEGLNLFRG